MIPQEILRLYVRCKWLQVLCILFVFSLPLNSLKAQNRNIDSLQTLFKNNKPDTTKVKNLNRLSWEYRNVGLYDAAMRYAKLALQLAQELKFKKGVADSYNNIGIVYRNQGNSSIAIGYYFKALKVAEELKDIKAIATYLGNIGIIYGSQRNYSKALEYFFKALKTDEELGNRKAISRHLGNIGGVYAEQKNYSKALDYYFKALKIAEELKDKNGVVRHAGNIGSVYHEQKVYATALDYHFKALKMAEEIEDKNGIAQNSGTIGSLYTTTKKYTEAEKYLKRALTISEKMGAINLQLDHQIYLSELYEKMGRSVSALEHYKKAIIAKDTLFNQDKNKEITRQEMNYEFDKKEEATKAENEKVKAIAEEKNRKQKIITWLIASGLLLVILFSGFIFRSLRITRKQKQIIEIKNAETELQKKIIEGKNKDIIDSIHYAKRIQDALMGEKVHISVHLPEHFILFMPKDIVSGDFHWGAEKQGFWYFAAVDCTGHGVPGAVMSMLGISFLNDIVFSEGMLNPAEILNRLRDKVVKELRQTGEANGSKDGMDVSLARLNLKTNELQWAGANNAINLIRNGELSTIKADKQPIGYHPEQRLFTNHEIQLQKSDSIYLYSDGYADQFGGPKGKKFKYKQLEDLLITNCHLPLKDQKDLLKRCFIQWRGSLEQLDDVCVFGVRV